MIQATDKNRMAAYTGIGLGLGAAGGATYGYFSNPHIKDNSVTDTFAREYADFSVKTNAKDFVNEANKMKKFAETGSINGISDKFIEKILDEDVEEFKALSDDQRKIKMNEKIDGLKESKGVETFDEVINARKNEILEDLMSTQEKKIAKFDKLVFAEGTTPDTIKEALKKNADILELPEFLKDFEAAEYRVLSLDESVEAFIKNKSVSDINAEIKAQKAVEQSALDEAKTALKAMLNKCREGKLSEVAESSGVSELLDAEDIKNFKASFDKVVKKFRLKAAAKWAGIVGGSAAIIGLGVAALQNNKKS